MKTKEFKQEILNLFDKYGFVWESTFKSDWDLLNICKDIAKLSLIIEEYKQCELLPENTMQMNFNRLKFIEKIRNIVDVYKDEK